MRRYFWLVAMFGWCSWVEARPYIFHAIGHSGSRDGNSAHADGGFHDPLSPKPLSEKEKKEIENKFKKQIGQLKAYSGKENLGQPEDINDKELKYYKVTFPYVTGLIKDGKSFDALWEFETKVKFFEHDGEKYGYRDNVETVPKRAVFILYKDENGQIKPINAEGALKKVGEDMCINLEQDVSIPVKDIFDLGGLNRLTKDYGSSGFNYMLSKSSSERLVLIEKKKVEQNEKGLLALLKDNARDTAQSLMNAFSNAKLPVNQLEQDYGINSFIMLQTLFGSDNQNQNFYSNSLKELIQTLKKEYNKSKFPFELAKSK